MHYPCDICDWEHVYLVSRVQWRGTEHGRFKINQVSEKNVKMYWPKTTFNRKQVVKEHRITRATNNMIWIADDNYWNDIPQIEFVPQGHTPTRQVKESLITRHSGTGHCALDLFRNRIQCLVFFRMGNVRQWSVLLRVDQWLAQGSVFLVRHFNSS